MIQVLNQEDTNVVIHSVQALSPGTRLLFDGSTYGIVQKLISGQRYQARLSDPTPCQKAEVLNWWAKTIDSQIQLAPSHFFLPDTEPAYLKAQCLTAEGYITWTLYYGAGAIASGNDLRSKGYCKFTAPGQFPAGNYRLVATRSIKGFPQGRAEANWILPAPASLLECGIGQATPALNLA